MVWSRDFVAITNVNVGNLVSLVDITVLARQSFVDFGMDFEKRLNLFTDLFVNLRLSVSPQRSDPRHG